MKYFLLGGLFVVVGLFCVLVKYFRRRKVGTKEPPPVQTVSSGKENALRKRQPARGRATKESPQVSPSSGHSAVVKGSCPSSPLYVDELKGVGKGGLCMAVHPQGKQVAVNFKDGSIKVIDVNLDDKRMPLPAEPKSVRNFIPGREVSTAVDFSADGTEIFVAIEYRSNLVRLRSSSGKLEVVYKKDTALQENNVRFLVASKGPWIVTSSEGSDTALNLWSYNCEKLGLYNTKQVKNFQMGISPRTGRFFGVAAWTSGVKLLEVVGTSSYKVEKAMDLKTSCGTQGLAISWDDTKAAVVCKDGTLLVYNIDVRYKVSEDPKKILSKTYENDPLIRQISSLAFSPNNQWLVGSSERHLVFIHATDLEVKETVLNAHGGYIDNMVVSPVGNFLLTLAKDEKPRLWRFPEV